MLKHDIGFFKAFDSIHLNPYESQLSSASDKYNPSYPRPLMLNLGKYSADAPLHNRANDINQHIMWNQQSLTEGSTFQIPIKDGRVFL